MKSQEAFEKWLNEHLDVFESTRREFAVEHRMNFEDLEWAFCSGYNKGLLKGLEEGSK